ncbi:MAG: hypothetical protein LBP52_10195 [Burkholderiaceae bacterium]|jgi:uncharacterized membrane protein|nr:hypothetical protein [Burkholderiaceae bacterium]
MSDDNPIQTPQPQPPLPCERADAAGDSDDLRVWGWISYILHLVVAVTAVAPGAQASVALLLIALILDLVKKDDAAGTWQASHFAWRIRTVLWAGVLYVLTVPLFLLLWLPGFLAWTVVSLWFLYRIVKGMVCMNRGAPMAAAAQ